MKKFKTIKQFFFFRRLCAYVPLQLKNSFLLTLCLWCSVPMCLSAQSSHPSWWTNRGVIITNFVITNDFAAANLGQLKWFATNAYDEFQTYLPGGAGTNIANMVAGFSVSNNYVAINIGQLKNVSAPFWVRLIEIGYTNGYPWTTNTISDDNDFAVANIGQVKNVFNFDLFGYSFSADSDADGLPDWWERKYFGSSTAANTMADSDSDGLSNLNEYNYLTNPISKDTDSDSLNDSFEIFYNQKVVYWDYYGQGTVPANVSNVMAIASGYFHNMALRSDGRVMCWGGNYYGQTDVPVGLSNVIAVAGGWYHSMALTFHGEVVCWGDNDAGQTNVPSNLSNIVAIAGGGSHSMALKSNGEVVCWGLNDYGQADVPYWLYDIVSISAGWAHSMALTSDGYVVSWGQNYFSQTDVPVDLSNVVAIAAGGFHSMALKSDGRVVCWGVQEGQSEYIGQTDVPADLSNVVAIAAGAYQSMALKSDGQVVCWGELGVPPSLSNVVAMAGGGGFCLALSNKGLNPVSNSSTDGDDMPDDWETLIVNASATDSVQRVDHLLPGADYDGDEVSNVDEYRLGTSPFDNSSVPPLLNFDAGELNSGGSTSINSIVRISRWASGIVTFRVYVAGGTAVNGTDYVYTNKFVSFPAGVAGGKFVPISILTNNVTAPGRTILLGMDQVAGPALIGTTNRQVITIGNFTADTDSDGLPDWWEVTYFGGSTSALPFVDSDSDGWDNMTEYKRGSDPAKPKQDDTGNLLKLQVETVLR
ncbi:MAG: hypothetical protein PHR77_02600 [Kiritimatiellae bacterium]|nr:hypothetical protein [Kiritimatiellia bacterium]MDD5523357.1 hypothetical protein [Kiritimatiellia bacterium]